jgi:hypothetical protein
MQLLTSSLLLFWMPGANKLKGSMVNVRCSNVANCGTNNRESIQHWWIELYAIDKSRAGKRTYLTSFSVGLIDPVQKKSTSPYPWIPCFLAHMQRLEYLQIKHRARTATRPARARRRRGDLFGMDAARPTARAAVATTKRARVAGLARAAMPTDRACKWPHMHGLLESSQLSRRALCRLHTPGVLPTVRRVRALVPWWTVAVVAKLPP